MQNKKSIQHSEIVLFGLEIVLGVGLITFAPLTNFD